MSKAAADTNHDAKPTPPTDIDTKCFNSMFWVPSHRARHRIAPAVTLRPPSRRARRDGGRCDFYFLRILQTNAEQKPRAANILRLAAFLRRLTFRRRKRIVLAEVLQSKKEILSAQIVCALRIYYSSPRMRTLGMKGFRSCLKACSCASGQGERPRQRTASLSRKFCRK